jgi:phosphoadenosine phosphosulfate reductase
VTITMIDRHKSHAVTLALSEASFDRDLMKRVAAVRSLVPGRILFTTSFGLEDQAITHAILKQALGIEVVTLDTGRLFSETYELWAETERQYGRRIPAFYPDQVSVESLVARQGIDGFYNSVERRLACCAVRKVEPLRRALAGAAAWIAGLRADQSNERAGTTFAAVDDAYNLIKLHPLFDWTREHVADFVREHGVPRNALHDWLRPMYACRSAGRARAAGRWWWEQEHKKECGLHRRDRTQPAVAAQTERSKEEVAR